MTSIVPCDAFRSPPGNSEDSISTLIPISSKEYDPVVCEAASKAKVKMINPICEAPLHLVSDQQSSNLILVELIGRLIETLYTILC